MEVLLVLIYAAMCIASFRIFRIPVNKWSLSTAVLGGIFGLSFLVLFVHYTKTAIFSFLFFR
jgi:hypothetical protein